jgi:hypothetical protein
MAGAMFSPWKGVPRPIATYIQKLDEQSREAAQAQVRAQAKAAQDVPSPSVHLPSKVESEKSIPPLNPPRREDPRQPEPHAVQAREAAIRRDAAAIQGECQLAAGGDWEKWQTDTEPYRASLKARASRARDDARPAQTAALEGRPGFPLFEFSPRERLAPVYDPASLDRFRKDCAVVAVSRWLREQGIDLIFVPLPPLTSIYVEQFLDPCPHDGVIAPHLRKMLAEFLGEDVEVIDNWRRFRSLRDVDSEYLYSASDGQLSPRGVRILVKDIADRIERYAFGTRARYALPIVKAAPARASTSDQVAANVSQEWNALSPAERERGKEAQASILTEVRMQDGSAPADDPASPVVIVSDRADPLFREQLIKELNLLVHVQAPASGAAEGFAEFVRNPKALEHCRVIVWLASEDQLAKAAALPAPIMKSLGSLRSALSDWFGARSAGR